MKIRAYLMKLTKAFVDKAPAPVDKDQVFYRDEELKGFALRVTASGVKSFVVETLISNKVRRMTLGRYGKLTAEQARNEAKKLLGKIATGIDPIAERKEGKAKAVTLKEVYLDYLKARKSLKASTLYDYERVMNVAFGDWQAKPILSITKTMIAARHTKLGERSEARANGAMRVLRALFNFAAGEYEDAKGRSLVLENPVKRLSHTRAWYRVERKQSVIKAHDLAAWYNAVISVEDERSTGKSAVLRDYFLLIIFTGLRRNEAVRMTWDQVDFKAKTLTISDTKNHEIHVLPLSDFLYNLFYIRHAESTSQYVFPGDGTTGYIVEPRKVMTKVIDKSGVAFTLHDLRRTFITIAESLDIPAYALKRLLNHKMNHDVTAGYIVMDVERLRKPMQQITDYLLKCMGAKKVTEVIQKESLSV
jgi:integrase